MQLSRQAATRIREKASRKTSKDLFVEEKNERRKNYGALTLANKLNDFKERQKAQAFPPLLVQQGAQHNGTSRRETKGRSKSFAILLHVFRAMAQGIKFYKIIKFKQQDSTVFFLLLWRAIYMKLFNLSRARQPVASSTSWTKMEEGTASILVCLILRSQRQMIGWKMGSCPRMPHSMDGVGSSWTWKRFRGGRAVKPVIEISINLQQQQSTASV